MEKRVLFAIFLSFLVLYIYQALVVKPVPKPTGAATSSASTPGAAVSNRPQAPSPQPGAATRETPSAAARPAAAPLVADPNQRDVRVETNDVIATFTNRGARLKSLRL